MTQGAAPSGQDQKLVRGMRWLQEHLLNHAELTFLEVLESAREDPIALRLLGVTRAKLGRAEEAIAHIEAAAAVSPESEVIWNDLAVALRDAGHAEAAAAALARANRLRDPGLNPLAALEDLTFSSERVTHDFTLVDYPYTAHIRWGSGRPPHPELAALIGEGRERYGAFVAELGEMQADFAKVAMGGTYEQLHPFWLNAWFSPLDAMALTGMLRRHNPGRMVEIGSGVSTKFARRAVAVYGLQTRLISIDPEPRNEIDGLCDQVIRKPLERCDPAMFERLGPGDVFFLDSSHRAFQGSDVTVFFLEILPRLKPGVIVHMHDIYLPDDYISGHVRRLWNEQYLLATALLFGASAFEILFPAWYVARDTVLRRQVRAALCRGPLSGLDLYGASFWMRKT